MVKGPRGYWQLLLQGLFPCFSSIEGSGAGDYANKVVTSSNADLIPREPTVLSEDIAGGFWR